VYVKVKCFLTEHHAMNAYWRSAGIASLILDRDTRWRRVVSFTPRSLYPHGKIHLVTIGWGWVDPKARLDAVMKVKFPPPAGNRTPIIRSSSLQPVAIPTELSRLMFMNDVCSKMECIFILLFYILVGLTWCIYVAWSPNQGVLPNVCGSRSPLRKAKVR
jgi:hypothetical protein